MPVYHKLRVMDFTFHALRITSETLDHSLLPQSLHLLGIISQSRKYLVIVLPQQRRG